MSVCTFPPSPALTAPQRRALSAAIVAVLLAVAGPSLADTPIDEFDPAFFAGGGVTPEITARFGRAATVLDGEYAITIRMNGDRVHDGVIRFAGGTDQLHAQPCLTDAMLVSYGVRQDALLPAASIADTDTETDQSSQAHDCTGIEHRVADATATFDLGRQVLDLRVPQASLSRAARDIIRVEDLDSGITAATLNYRASSYTTRNTTGTNTTNFLGLQAGINLGHWNLRHAGSYRVSNHGHSYEVVNTYAERAMPALGSRLIIGEHYTSGNQLDSFRVRGATWASDQRMLPESASGYAPIVRGVAETNALVRVKQRGITLVEMTVAPGAFVIDDLNPTGQGGDLEVDIVESDGRIRSFIVPNASTPELLREGQNRYAVTVGQFNEARTTYQPWLAQASLSRGLGGNLTGYGAGAVAQDYRSVLLGMARNTRFGALSFDITHAQAHLGPYDVHSGYQLHARYSRNFADRGAALTLGMFRYSTEGYFSMSDAFRTKEALRHADGASEVSRVRGRMEASVHKSLGRFGSINFSGASQDYWGTRPRTTHISAGYNAMVGRMTVSMNAMRSALQMSDGTRHDSSVYLGLSMPLGTSPRSPMASLMTEHRSDGASSQRAGVTGRFGEQYPVSYAASISQGRGSGTQLDLSAQHSTSIADLQASMTRGRNFNSTSWGINGGIVAHREGVTFAPPLGETIAVVSAPGAAGAHLGYGNVRIGHNGLAVVPYLTPYRMNTVNVDSAGASLGVQFNDTSARVAPIAGATVRIQFDSKAGTATLIETHSAGGLQPPFGAEVLDTDGKPVGLVGQGGRIFIHSANALSELLVRWGDADDTACRITMPDGASDPRSQAYNVTSAPCISARRDEQHAVSYTTSDARTGMGGNL